MSLQADPAQLDMFAAVIEPAVAPCAEAGRETPPATDPVAAPAPADAPAAAQGPSAKPTGSAPAKGAGARPPGRPMRRARLPAARATVMSPEARRAAEERERKMIEEFIAQGRVTKCPTRWAYGSVNMTVFGSDV